MHISLNIAATALPLASVGLILPQLASGPAVSGSGREGGVLSADTSDSWTYDGAPASVSQRQYQLQIDGAEAVAAGPDPAITLPGGTAGGQFRMLLRAQVAQAPDLWSPWQTIATGMVTGLPALGAATATATGETAYDGTITTDTGNGTLFWMVTASALPPAAGILKAAESQPVTASGLQQVSGNGLAAQTQYHIHFLHQDAVGGDSAITSSAAFTTNAPPVGEPAAFGAGDWSVTDLGSGGDARVTITALPDDGGAALKAIFYSIDGGPWVPLPTNGTGSHDLMDLFVDGVQAELRLVAENLIGLGPESAPKQVTTTLPAPGAWAIADTGDGRFTLSDAPPPMAAPDIINNGDGSFAVLA